MEYDKFYRLYIDYNFMLKNAVHFGVYSDNGLKSIQNELGKLLELMADDPAYMQYKPLLHEMYRNVSSENDISSFLIFVQKLQGRERVRKFICDIPLFLLCMFIIVTAGAMPRILGL